MEDLRIGVFLCGCVKNISNVINIKNVIKRVEKLLDVVHVVDEEYLCSEEMLNGIKEDIKRHNLNRLVIAACQPKSNLVSMFNITFYEARLNPYLDEWVNIREQCAWVHSDEPRKATEKAIDLIGMAVAKSRLAEPLRLPLPQVDNDKCISCGVCELICPFGAVELHKSGAYSTRIDEFLCNCCGICVAACPAMVIEMPRYTKDQLLAQIKVAFTSRGG